MVEQVTVNLENLSEDDKKRFWDIVEKANKPKVWNPEVGDTYYLLSSYGDVMSDSWSNHSMDIGRYALGNCFKTPKEAKFAIERLKVIAELKRFAKENNPPDFKNNHLTTKYIIIIRSTSGKIEPVWVTSMYSCVVFATEKIAKAAIEKVGEDRLKKYYFCIPEEGEVQS